MAMSRSENMARIHARNTEPEVLLRSRLWAKGIRFRINYRTPGGRADIAMPRQRVAIFVDGCFWHGCPEHYVRPRGASPLWDRKLAENVSRDRRQSQRLLDAGWMLIRLWEHEVREDAEAAALHLLSLLEAGEGGSWPEWRVVRVTPLGSAGDFERRYLKTLTGESERQEDSPRITTKIGRVDRSAPSASRQQPGYH